MKRSCSPNAITRHKRSIRMAVIGLSLVLGALLLWGACALDNEPSEVDRINAAITAAGANWVAEETWVTRLNTEERRLLAGEDNMALPENRGPEPFMDPADDQLAAPQDYPAYFSWKEHLGYNWMSPVRNQLACGGCWAFAAIAAMEATMKIAWQQPDVQPDLSEMHVITCDTNSNGCNGGQHYNAFRYMYSYGIPPEACFPFSQPLQKTCNQTCSNWQDIAEKIDDYYQVGTSLDALKAEIMRGPVATSMQVYADFDSYKSGVYQHVTGAYEGGHAVAIVGWDDSLQCFICKNSWGQYWGEQGYFRIKYFDSGLGSISNYTCRYYGGAEPPPPPTGLKATNQYSQGVAGAYLRQVNIRWNELPDATTYGFNLYSSSSTSAQSFQRINSSPLFTNTYTDTNTGGDTGLVRYYAVTAMLATGKESAFSSIVMNQD